MDVEEILLVGRIVAGIVRDSPNSRKTDPSMSAGKMREGIRTDQTLVVVMGLDGSSDCASLSPMLPPEILAVGGRSPAKGGSVGFVASSPTLPRE